MILKYIDFINENNNQIFSGEYVSDHICDITPEDSDIPDFFIDKYIKPNKFILSKVKISDLLESDLDFKEYVDSGEDRYGDLDEYDAPIFDELYYPVVVVDGEVLDGYSRMAHLKTLGVDEVDAYVNI